MFDNTNPYALRTEAVEGIENPMGVCDVFNALEKLSGSGNDIKAYDPSSEAPQISP